MTGLKDKQDRLCAQSGLKPEDALAVCAPSAETILLATNLNQLLHMAVRATLRDPVTLEEIQEDEATRHARHDRMAWKCVELLAAKMAPKVLAPVPGQKRVHDDIVESDPTDSVA